VLERVTCLTSPNELLLANDLQALHQAKSKRSPDYALKDEAAVNATPSAENQWPGA